MPRKRSYPGRHAKTAARARSTQRQPSIIEPRPAKPGHPDPVARNPSLPFPIVGIGSSAGGLEASTQLLRALPANTGMAFVLIQHLSPSRVSMLPEILGRATTMPVRTIESGMAVEPDHVYVIPPDSSVELVSGALRLRPRERSDGHYHPVDIFLRSLAQEQGHLAIGVILSGTANDGTAGCEEIKADGGVTLAQDESAQQDGMPRSAAATGCVDFVLPPDQIARELARIAKHPLIGFSLLGRPPLDPNQLGGVLELLRNRNGVDFTHYKQSTLLRRIARRMVLHKVVAAKDYERLLTGSPSELDALFQDILINVTSFFRNPEAFELLKHRVFPEVVNDPTRTLPVRIWVLGCSTGEEAYSLAMAFTEFAAETGRMTPVQIFASDLSAPGIEHARSGVYSKAIERDVSPERLQRFFTSVDGDYRVTKEIRDMVVFARHNALADPPFSRVDLISCRNMLIYLDPILQQKLVPVLHYALNPNGFLLLGPSETIGGPGGFFELLDPKYKLYRRRATSAPLIHYTPGLRSDSDLRREALLAKNRELVPPVPDPQREADRLLLSRYAPAGVLVNSDYDILQFRGDTGPFLAPGPGRASLNLLKMLREGLLAGVRSALLRAKREKRAVRQENLRVDGATARRVSVEVIPIPPASGRDLHYMVIFDDAASARERSRSAGKGRKRPLRGERPEEEVIRLRLELSANREYLQSIIEQQEATNEELQSANEEVQSSNEELQSINEELETSREEIQASSEELATVNDELHSRNLELTRSHSDLDNLIASVELPIVMLGTDLRIRRFTPSAERLLNLIGSDVGRPISDIKTNLDVHDLDALLHEVLEKVTPIEQVIRDKRGRWFSLRLRPYRTQDNRIDGVVLAFIDIDSLKLAEEAVRAGAERLTILQDQAPLGIRETDLGGHYIRVNEGYSAITGYTQDELLGRHFSNLIVPEDRPRAQHLWEQVLSGKVASYRDERRYIHKQGHVVWVETHGFALRDPSGKPSSGVAFVQDVTERKAAEAELQAADRSKNEFLAMLAHELRNPLAPLLNVVQLLEGDEITPQRIASLRGILERQIRNLSRMTDDLLDVARISQGRLQVQPEVIEAGGLVRRAAELFRPTIESFQQRLHLSLPSEPVYLEADPVRLEQLVDNLLTNASKFTPAHGNIWLSLLPPALPGGMLEIRVRDDGSGIDPALIHSIFEPFTQGDQALDRRRGGLGIGLTLVRSVAELHGGTVEAQSAGPSQGAEFVVRLPSSGPPGRERIARKRDSKRTALVGRRVLVVDDNRDGAETLAMLLRNVGHHVAVVGDGQMALAAALEFHPEVVLLDIGLPGKSGYEVAQELRSQPETGDIPIVAVSGYGQEEDRRRAQQAGINHYFTKPMDIEALLDLLGGGDRIQSFSEPRPEVAPRGSHPR